MIYTNSMDIALKNLYNIKLLHDKSILFNTICFEHGIILPLFDNSVRNKLNNIDLSCNIYIFINKSR